LQIYEIWILYENKNDLVYIADVIKKHDVIETLSSGKTNHFLTNFDTNKCMCARKNKLIMKILTLSSNLEGPGIQ
jgi:hypothetical protein